MSVRKTMKEFSLQIKKFSIELCACGLYLTNIGRKRGGSGIPESFGRCSDFLNVARLSYQLSTVKMYTKNLNNEENFSTILIDHRFFKFTICMF